MPILIKSGKLLGSAINRPALRQLVRFSLVGALNTAIGLGIIYALMWALAMNPFSANVIGYSVALVNSYFLNKYYTFTDIRRTRGQIIIFLFVFCICYALQVVVLWLLVKMFAVNPYFAQPIAMIVYTLANFIGNKFLTFKA